MTLWTDYEVKPGWLNRISHRPFFRGGRGSAPALHAASRRTPLGNRRLPSVYLFVLVAVALGDVFVHFLEVAAIGVALVKHDL